MLVLRNVRYGAACSLTAQQSDKKPTTKWQQGRIKNVGQNKKDKKEDWQIILTLLYLYCK